MKKRPVAIEIIHTAGGNAISYAVQYLDRRPYCRHWAACFDSKYSTLDDVRKWIEKQGNLQLTPTPGEKEG